MRLTFENSDFDQFCCNMQGFIIGFLGFLGLIFISWEFTFPRVQMQDFLVDNKLSWIFSLLIFRQIWLSQWFILRRIIRGRKHHSLQGFISIKILLSLPCRFYDLRINYKDFLWENDVQRKATKVSKKICQNLYLNSATSIKF